MLFFPLSLNRCVWISVADTAEFMGGVSDQICILAVVVHVKYVHVTCECHVHVQHVKNM